MFFNRIALPAFIQYYYTHSNELWSDKAKCFVKRADFVYKTKQNLERQSKLRAAGSVRQL